MATGSLKSIDGCLTAARCRMEGVKSIAFESGGNSGSALTRYGQQAGLETFFFCPAENTDLLDSRLFADSRTHLIGVAERGRVKELAGLFARTAGIRHVPDKSWRYDAAMFRGLFILEQMLAATGYDWITQTVSAGFGPIGIYQVLEAFRPDLQKLPRFLGIQQEANCPMFAAWKPEAAGSLANSEHKDKLLTRVMYDNSPQTYQTFADLKQLLLLSQGDLLTINETEFATYIYSPAPIGPVPELLLSRDLAITMKSGQVLEKTGLMALAGTLKAIDNGTIEAGSRVLCCLTSGASQADGIAWPELTVRSEQDVLEYVALIKER
jgi:threonine synthase